MGINLARARAAVNEVVWYALVVLRAKSLWIEARLSFELLESFFDHQVVLL